MLIQYWNPIRFVPSFIICSHLKDVFLVHVSCPDQHNDINGDKNNDCREDGGIFAKVIELVPDSIKVNGVWRDSHITPERRKMRCFANSLVSGGTFSHLKIKRN